MIFFKLVNNVNYRGIQCKKSEKTKKKAKSKEFNNTLITNEFTKKDIEKSYDLDNLKGTEAYYSNRYGWTLRKSID